MPILFFISGITILGIVFYKSFNHESNNYSSYNKERKVIKKTN